MVLYPLLPVGILKVIDGIAFPVDSHTKQRGREETLFSIYGKIGYKGSH